MTVGIFRGVAPHEVLTYLILRKWVISKEWFIMQMSVYRILSFQWLLWSNWRCVLKKFFKMHSNMPFRIYIPDVFFNSHILYISQVVLIFFSTVLVAGFVVICYGFIYKCSEIEPFLSEAVPLFPFLDVSIFLPLNSRFLNAAWGCWSLSSSVLCSVCFRHHKFF